MNSDEKIKQISISIILLTKNAGITFKSVLDGIFSQSIKPLEILVIDSGSKDNTLEIAREYPVRIVEIPPEDFRHGQTRNFGANLAEGTHVVYLTQDAIPGSTDWLKELIKPFRDNNIAGVYERQIPRKDENIIDKFFCLSLYPDKDVTWRNRKNLGIDTVFSDVNSAIRKDILLEHPFDNDIIVSEDHEWAHRVLKKGFSLFYNTKASVIHSHSYDLASLFKRHFDIGVSYNKIKTKRSVGHLLKKGIKVHFQEIVYITKNGYIYLIPYCIFKDTLKFVAIILGKNERLLPKIAKIKFSNYKRHWV